MGRVLFWCTATLIVLAVALVIATPWILRAAVPEAFGRFGVQASVTGGSLSLLRREVTLEGLTVGSTDSPALSLGELGVGLEVRALIEGRFKLRHLRVKDVSLNAERLLALRKRDDDAPMSRQGSLPLELAELDLEDVRLVSLGNRIGHDVRIARLQVSDVSALLAGKHSKVDLQGAIDEGRVDLQLDIGLDGGKLQAAGKYRFDEVSVAGWAGLGSAQADPVSAGLVNGRGDIQAGYAFEAANLDVHLDGRVRLTGLGVAIDPLVAERGDANWQGRLSLRWSPDLALPTLHGDGSLEVDSVHLAVAQSSQPPVHAAVRDISWRGDFDWRGGFESQGAVLGSSVEVIGATGSTPEWRTHSEDFSWRLHARIEDDSGKFGARIENLDVARFSASVSADDNSVEISAEKLSVDEMRSAQSGDLVLGAATVDTLKITEAGSALTGDGATYRADRLTAKGLSGDFSGKLHAAHVSAESLDYTKSERRLRADEVDIASVGFSVPAWLGADELTVKSVRAGSGESDIWLSGLKATRIHGDAGGTFGAEAVDVVNMFQSGSTNLSWEASHLKVLAIHGDIADSARISAIDLGELKMGIDETSWDASGLHAMDLVVGMIGSLQAARLGFAKLEHRRPGAADLRITELDARGLRAHDTHAVIDTAMAATLEYKLPEGDEFQIHGLEARELAGDRSSGVEASHFSVAGGTGSFTGGARLSAAALETRGVTVAIDGGVAVEKAQLRNLSHSDADSAVLDLERLDVAVLRRTPGGRLSATSAALESARFARADGASWVLAELAAGNLDWDGGVRVNAARATLASASQLAGQSRDWRARGLRATDFQLTLPGDVEAATLSADIIDGGSGYPAWKITAVDSRDLSSSERDGHRVGSLSSDAVTVTDKGNGAALDLRRAQIEAGRVSGLQELSAERLQVESLRLRSDRPDWPSRLTVAEVIVAKPLLRFDGVLDLAHVSAQSPYLIIAQSKDNVWMWPPLPGGGDGKADSEADSKAGSTGGVRVAGFITRGPGRIAYIDRGTEPAFQLVLDPIVVAIQNLDTTLPGNVARFRARGTGSRFSALSLHGELRKAVEGFDLDLKFAMKGADLPALNPYVARHEPFAITMGRGDVRSEVAIENGALDGQMDLLLSGVEMQRIAGGAAFLRIDPASFPIHTALALLKDRQGNIRLTVPLQAHTRDQRYDFVDNFQQDFNRTVTTAGKIAANLPGKTLDGALRLLERTISLLPGVSAERYAPVEFAVGADDLAATPLLYLDQLGKRMREHESLELALCGRSVSLDGETAVEQSTGIDALFAEASKGVYRTYGPGRKGLLALAEARADMVRRDLHEVHGIPNQRLFSCDPDVDEDAGAKPRVDLQVKTPARRKGLFGIFP